MHACNALLKWYTKKTPHILHQGVLGEAMDRIQETTGLRPTNEKLLKGIHILSVPPRIKDHMKNTLTSKIKCGAFWNKVLGHSELLCSRKRKRNAEIMETERHL